jgi:hypothetical protein
MIKANDSGQGYNQLLMTNYDFPVNFGEQPICSDSPLFAAAEPFQRPAAPADTSPGPG